MHIKVQIPKEYDVKASHKCCGERNASGNAYKNNQRARSVALCSWRKWVNEDAPRGKEWSP
jgi:hypothetical protein